MINRIKNKIIGKNAGLKIKCLSIDCSQFKLPLLLFDVIIHINLYHGLVCLYTISIISRIIDIIITIMDIRSFVDIGLKCLIVIIGHKFGDMKEYIKRGINNIIVRFISKSNR